MTPLSMEFRNVAFGFSLGFSYRDLVGGSMKIFVGYGYNDRDRWVEEFVFPLIGAFGDEVITGEELQGDRITDAVVQKITESDALIGFLTRRGEPDGRGLWGTHRWVIEEIATAIPLKRLLVEVREKGVDDQGGIAGDRQRIVYDEQERDKCLVELVTTIGKWHRLKKMKLKLLPQEYYGELFPLHRDPDLRCSYKIMSESGVDQGEEWTKLVPVKGGLFIFTKDIPRQALIQVHIEHHGKHWLSNFESMDSLNVLLEKER